MDDDDFGDFTASPAPEMTTDDATFLACPADPATIENVGSADFRFPQPVRKDEDAMEPPAAPSPDQAEEDEDDFGDFGEAPLPVALPLVAPAPAPAPAPPNLPSVAAANGEFGDFGEPAPAPAAGRVSYDVADDLCAERSPGEFLAAVDLFLARSLGETPGGTSGNEDAGFGAASASDASFALARRARSAARRGDELFGGGSGAVGGAVFRRSLHACCAGWDPAVSIGIGPNTNAATWSAPKPWHDSLARTTLAAATQTAHQVRDVLREATGTVEASAFAVAFTDVTFMEVSEVGTGTEPAELELEATERVAGDAFESAPETITALFHGLDMTNPVPRVVVEHLQTPAEPPPFARLEGGERSENAFERTSPLTSADLRAAFPSPAVVSDEPEPSSAPDEPTLLPTPKPTPDTDDDFGRAKAETPSPLPDVEEMRCVPSVGKDEREREGDEVGDFAPSAPAPTHVSQNPLPDDFADLFGPVLDTKQIPIASSMLLSGGPPTVTSEDDDHGDAFAALSAPVSTEQVVKAPRAFDTELKAQAPVTDGDEDAFGDFETSPAANETSPAPAFVAGKMDFDFGGFAAPEPALSGVADAAADFFGETFVAAPPVATDENVFGEFQ